MLLWQCLRLYLSYILTFFLKRVYKRIKNDTSRPLLKGDNLKEKIEKILNERSKIYEKTANIIISTDDKSQEEIAKEIIEKIK